MDIFAQNKLLVRIVILLAALNIISMVVLLWRGFAPPPPPPPPPHNFQDVAAVLEKELNLTSKQAEQIKTLRFDYFEKEKVILQELRNERDSMNTAMFNKNFNEELVLALARRVAENEYKMELLRLDQARALKSICTPGQLEKFEKLVIEIRDYFRPDNQPPRK
jgi:Spy/CpxP family protein refolding chaperone